MKKLTEGIYLDGSRGIYNVLNVVLLAIQYGMELSDFDKKLVESEKANFEGSEELFFLSEEAEEYLSSLCEEGFTFCAYDDNYGVYSLKSLENAY